MTTSLSSILNQKLTKVLTASKTATEYKVLVLDKFSAKLISSCYKVPELIEGHNIYSIEILSVTKKPEPHREAIYLLEPSEDSIDMLLKDWPGPRSYQEQPDPVKPKRFSKENLKNMLRDRVVLSPEKPKHVNNFKGARVYFTGKITEKQWARIESSYLASFITNFEELNISYLPDEERVFTSSCKNNLKTLYSTEITTKTHSVEKSEEDHSPYGRVVTSASGTDMS